MAAGVKSFSKTFVWILMGLLIAGLAGFGALNLTGTLRVVATVGNQTVSVDDYARELQREIRAIEAQTGQPLQMTQVQQLGIDQSALGRLVALAALDSETADLGISIGDENLQQEILEIPAFQGVDGSFDREAYRFALDQAGMDEVAFEQDLRAEAARTLVQGAIVAGVRMPPQIAQVLAEYIGARRSFTVATLTAEALETPLPEPTEGDLKSYYDEHPEAFTLPETKRLTYVQLTPEMLLDEVEVDEAALRDLYEERSAQYRIPERRLVERLVFADEAAAADAKAQLEVGGTTFETLLADRELSLADIDLGDVTRDDLGAAADAVFAAEIGDIVGPLPSDLGPALFRVNGTLAAQDTSFEEALPELRDELARDRARRLIDAQAESIDDLLAGGATLEELADESDMELGTMDWTADSSDGIAAYDAFREAAAAVAEGDFPEVAFLEDGGLFALRLEEVLPERPEPFDQARNRVSAAWRLDRIGRALHDRAEELVDKLKADGDFTALGVPFRVENGLTRTAFLDGTPPDFMTQVFEMEPGEIRVIGQGNTVFVVRLDSVQKAEDSPELATMRDAMGQELDQALAQALFAKYADDVRRRANPMVDQRALNAILAGFQ